MSPYITDSEYYVDTYTQTQRERGRGGESKRFSATLGVITYDMYALCEYTRFARSRSADNDSAVVQCTPIAIIINCTTMLDQHSQ